MALLFSSHFSDGTFDCICSLASNLDEQDTNGLAYIFIRDIQGKNGADQPCAGRRSARWMERSTIDLRQWALYRLRSAANNLAPDENNPGLTSFFMTGYDRDKACIDSGGNSSDPFISPMVVISGYLSGEIIPGALAF